MKLILLIFVFNIFQRANAQLEFYECPIHKSYKFLPDAKFIMYDSVVRIPALDTGNTTVFKYEHSYDCLGNGHEGVVANLMWSVPKNQTDFEFTFRDSVSRQSKIFYFASSGPPFTKYNFEMKYGEGKIEGQLINKLWEVKGFLKMTMYNRYTKVTVTREIIVDGSYEQWTQKSKDKKRNYKFAGF